MKSCDDGYPSCRHAEATGKFCKTVCAATAEKTKDNIMTHNPQAADTGVSAEAAFDDGWRLCAKWAKRDDLLADMDSAAFKDAKVICLEAIAASRPVAGALPASPKYENFKEAMGMADPTAQIYEEIGNELEVLGYSQATEHMDELYALAKRVRALYDLAATPPSAALATPSPAQAEPTNEELLGNFRLGGHEAPTYWPHGDDLVTPGPLCIADIVKVAGIGGLKASPLLTKLKAAGFDVTLNQPLAPDHVAALLVMPLATGAAEGAEPTADAERFQWLVKDFAGLDAKEEFPGLYKGCPDGLQITAENFAAAIDAARAAQKGQP